MFGCESKSHKLLEKTIYEWPLGPKKEKKVVHALVDLLYILSKKQGLIYYKISI